MEDLCFNKLRRQSRQVYQKTELILDPSAEALQILLYLKEKLIDAGFFSTGLEFIPTI